MDVGSDDNFKYVFKFIVVGSVAVGKTSLINQFVRDKFQGNYLATLGVDVQQKVINISEEKVKILIWDTAGSENFRSLTRSYYRAVSGILLIYDITNEKSFEELEYWLGECQRNANPNVSIYLIGNKCDQETNRRVTKAEAKVFAKKHNLKVIETSAKDSTNVLKCFLDLSNDVFAKIENKEIDPYDKESGARFSEWYLEKSMDPNFKETNFQFCKPQNKKDCC